MRKDAKLYCPNPRDPTEGLRLKKNGVWERQETVDGRRHSWSGKDPVEVWRKRAESIAALHTACEEKERVEEHGPLFEEVADRYRAAVLEMKHGTQKSYLPAIARARRHFEGRRMKDIEPWEIKAFLASLGKAHTTVSNQKSVINSIYQLYIDDPEWHGDYNPAKMTQIPRGLTKGRRQPPGEEQIRIIKEAALSPSMDDLLPIVYLCTGERRGEGCAIQLRDIDFDAGVIHIEKAVEWIGNQPRITVTKTEAGVREIPLLSILRGALAPYRHLPSGTYIIGLQQKPVTASWYRRHWTAFWRSHGFAHPVERVGHRVRNGKDHTYIQRDWAADVCCHQLRHEYVCMLAEAGVPEEVAVQLVGHANAKMIHEVYMHLKSRMISGIGKKLDSVLGPALKVTG